MKDKTIVGKSKIGGRGVFSTINLKKNQMIEICEVIPCPKEDLEHIKKTTLFNYYFCWYRGGGAIALGNGSLYNHSYDPNAQYITSGKCLIFKALVDIKKGEEITVNYNGDWWNKEPVWFDKKK